MPTKPKSLENLKLCERHQNLSGWLSHSSARVCIILSITARFCVYLTPTKMICLLAAIKAEAETLEKIASAPLPDVASPIAPDTDVFDATSLDQEMKSLIDISGSWALDMPDVLGDISVSDIRTLQPDAGKMLNDADGDKSSLYWYVMCASATRTRYDFGHDPTFHGLVDRVVFGFSLQMEKNVDVVVTRLTDELMRAVSLSNILKRRKAKQHEEKAACVIQRIFTRKQRGIKQMVTAMSKATP